MWHGKYSFKQHSIENVIKVKSAFAINKIYSPLTNINNPNYIYKNIN